MPRTNTIRLTHTQAAPNLHLCPVVRGIGGRLSFEEVEEMAIGLNVRRARLALDQKTCRNCGRYEECEDVDTGVPFTCDFHKETPEEAGKMTDHDGTLIYMRCDCCKGYYVPVPSYLCEVYRLTDSTQRGPHDGFAICAPCQAGLRQQGWRVRFAD